MDSTLAILDLLVSRYSFREVAALIDAGVLRPHRGDHEVAAIEQLCAFGERLLGLDAEDFGLADSATDANTMGTVAGREPGVGVPADLVARSALARMPQSPHEANRGALGSLRPAFELLLEAIEVRWWRRETAAMVATIHMTSEYLPLLVWESALGHAGDPARMDAAVGGPDSRWGVQDDRACPHIRSYKAAAHRCLHADREPDAGWRAYLDKQHSVMAQAIGVCAASCQADCSVRRRRPPDQLADLKRRCKTATAYTESALVQLRHSSPAGHGFGVPSPREIMEVWTRTRDGLGRHEPAVLVDDGYVLPGLSELFSALADHPIRPGTLITDTANALRAALAG